MLKGIGFAHHRFLWMGSGRVVLGWDERFGQRTLFHDLEDGRTFKGTLARGMVILARPSADGRWLAAVGPGGRVDILSGVDGEVFSSNDRHTGTVIEVALSSDFEICRVLSTGEDGSVRVWPVDPVPAAGARQPRPFGFLEKQGEWVLAEGSQGAGEGFPR
jgi:WD40 repeat protein